MAYKLSKNRSSGQYPRLRDLMWRSYGSCFLPCQEETGQAARKPSPGKDASTAMADPFLVVLAITLFPPFSLRFHRKKQAKQFLYQKWMFHTHSMHNSTSKPTTLLFALCEKQKEEREEIPHTHSCCRFTRMPSHQSPPQTHHQAMNSMSAN